jgi:hypothetical protein
MRSSSLLALPSYDRSAYLAAQITFTETDWVERL